MPKIELTEYERKGAREWARLEANGLVGKNREQSIELGEDAIKEAAQAASSKALEDWNAGQPTYMRVTHPYLRKLWRDAYITYFVNCYHRYTAHLAFATSEPGGHNIYDPFFIHDEGGLRYSVRQNAAGGVYIARHLSWSDAVFVAESLNAGNRGDVLAKFLESPHEDWRMRYCDNPEHGGNKCWTVFTMAGEREREHITYREAFNMMYGCDPVIVEKEA